MITDEQIASDIPVHDLIYGLCKESLVELEEELEEVGEDSEEGAIVEASMDVYSFIMAQIERVVAARKPKVVVEVQGGVAYVTSTPANVEVEVIDHD